MFQRLRLQAKNPTIFSEFIRHCVRPSNFVEERFSLIDFKKVERVFFFRITIYIFFIFVHTDKKFPVTLSFLFSTLNFKQIISFRLPVE